MAKANQPIGNSEFKLFQRLVFTSEGLFQIMGATMLAGLCGVVQVHAVFAVMILSASMCALCYLANEDCIHAFVGCIVILWGCIWVPVCVTTTTLFVGSPSQIWFGVTLLAMSQLIFVTDCTYVSNAAHDSPKWLINYFESELVGVASLRCSSVLFFIWYIQLD